MAKVSPTLEGLKDNIENIKHQGGGMMNKSMRARPKLRVKNTDDWKIPAKDIKVVKRIAAGSFGEVYRGELYGVKVAVKKPLKDISSDALKKFLEEVQIMTKLHHPNIVVCLGACVEPGKLMLILEYLEYGSLYDFLRSKHAEKVLNYSKVLKFATDIARGMRYLHHRVQIIQRDLKSRNLLVDDSYNVKICDFGLSRENAEDEETLTACGTPYWAAPEVILGAKYDQKADVYSFAIVLWEIITREEPYDGQPGMNIAFLVAQDGLRPDVPAFCPDPYAQLMTACWDDQPENRPSFTEILNTLHEMSRAAKFQAAAAIK